MLLEHLIYSAAIAIIAGMIFLRYTGRDPSWIIILMTIAPDSDYVVNIIMRWLGFSYPVIINHGDFHNFVGLTVFSLVAALILSKAGLKFSDVLVCSMIGYVAHFVEDFIVYPPAYSYLYPFSFRSYGINLIPETANLWGVAGTEVLGIGIIVFCIAVCIRMYFDGSGWTIKNYINDGLHFGKNVKYYAEVLLSGNFEELRK